MHDGTKDKTTLFEECKKNMSHLDCLAKLKESLTENFYVFEI